MKQPQSYEANKFNCVKKLTEFLLKNCTKMCKEMDGSTTYTFPDTSTANLNGSRLTTYTQTLGYQAAQIASQISKT